MRRLESYELKFWNTVSVFILIDAGFELELKNGMIVGIGIRGNE